MPEIRFESPESARLRKAKAKSAKIDARDRKWAARKEARATDTRMFQISRWQLWVAWALYFGTLIAYGKTYDLGIWWVTALLSMAHVLVVIIYFNWEHNRILKAYQRIGQQELSNQRAANRGQV